MDSVNIKVEGLHAMVEGSQERADAEIEAIMDLVAEKAIETVTVRTGYTQSTIRREGNAVVAGGGALYLELGTYKMDAQPFLIPAFEDVTRNAAERIQMAVVVSNDRPS